MQTPHIHSYNGQQPQGNTSFYVLSKGENAGKPLDKPCPNCFVATCATDIDRDYWFWLSWGLWKSKSFHILLRGSVIPFLRICDYKEIITGAAAETAERPEQLKKAIQTMRDLEQLEKATLQKLLIVKEMRIAVFHKVLKRA